MHFVDSGSHGRNQLFYRVRAGSQRSPAAALRRVHTAVATSILVLWPSGILYWDLAFDRHRRDHPAGICTQATSRPTRDDRLHDCHRFPELHGMGPPHVRERHEPVLGESLLCTDFVYYDSCDDPYAVT